MKLKNILLLGVLFIINTTYSQDANFHIYLCFGQSNMHGAAPIEEMDKTVNPRFKVMQSLDCDSIGKSGEWRIATPPLCQCDSGLSPADYFGGTMVNNLPDSIKVGVINVAIPGCDIRLFDKDIYKEYTDTHKEPWFAKIINSYSGNPYQHLIDLAKKAQEDGVIKGILLHQGETNTGDQMWPQYVKKVYNHILEDLNLSADSTPLLSGEVVHEDQQGKCSKMNDIIAKLPQVIPTAHVISSSGCPAPKDRVHFSPAGYRKLGARYAEKMLSLMGIENLVPETFKNPILPGYHPDPSICRVGDDYYMVNSTFIWYPGIPIYHSKDLVNWKLIGHGINRPDQIDLEGLKDRNGIYAVTIRHHEGVFYLITTCVGCEGNFYITSTDPAGEWSDPVWLPDAPGIDPSLMWDDDGKCYYTGHMSVSEQQWPTQCGIWTQELDLKTKKLTGKREVLTYGHANNASYTEGPHIYKIKDKYLLMVSEGGTGTFHALSVHHSDSLFGPYVADMINPVITHRHLGKDYPIQATGHGDLVKTQNGEWWCVLLSKRLIGDNEATLTRETFLAKVTFEGETPVFNAGEGKVLEEQTRPNLPWTPFEPTPEKDYFESKKLGLEYCFIRIPKQPFYALDGEHLNIKLQPQVMDSLVNASLIVRRIESPNFEAGTKLSFKTSKSNEEAGLVVYRTNENHYALMKRKNDLVLYKSFKGEKSIVHTIPYNKKDVYLKAVGHDFGITFSYGENEDNMKPIGEKQSLVVIVDGNGNQFNGPGVGMYATSNGKQTKGVAQFNWFSYKNN
ncbi:hypothetical protein MHTCC0001_02890 [Flavobacteriaceae bacterium MHTCC 0001]